MLFNTRLNTVYILVGQPQCGKSTFAGALAVALSKAGQSRGMNFQTSILSSDNYRHLLLQDSNIDKMSPIMLEVSGQAFELLFSELKAVTSFPVNHDFVIVDTTGLNEKFRDDVRTLAKSRGYAVELVTFEYSKAEALKGVKEELHPLILNRLSRMKRSVMPTLKAREYNKRTKISERSPRRWSDLVVEIEGVSLLSSCLMHMNKDQGLAIIGDTHEHTVALSSLLEKLHDIDSKLQIVHIGDYLDKGFNTEGMLKFIQSRVKDHGDIMIQGNHEAYVVRRLRGEIDPNPEIEEKYITSYRVLKDRPDLQEILFDLWDNHTIPYLKVTGDRARTLYATHAPCEEVYLGKLSPFAIRAQRNLSTKGPRSKDYRTEYDFLFNEASSNRPLHVFGHVAHKSEVLVYKNKIFLDTGAVYGNKLTAMVYKNDRYDFVSVDAEKLDKTDKELPTDATVPLKVDKKFDIKDYDLDPKELRFINGFMKRGIKFISGTMAPAPSTTGTTFVLESLEAGLDYFRKRGVKQVVLEPKYMGSRCQLYLFRGRLDDCFAVSRNGYIIDKERVPGLTELLERELSKFEDDSPQDEEIILDGELLPWSALGKGLIEDNFRSYSKLINHELKQLDDPMFANLQFPTKPDLSARVIDLVNFDMTLALYDKDMGGEAGQQPLEFKAFSTLKVDGEVRTGEDPSLSFQSLNKDDYLNIDLEVEDDVKWARGFFEAMTVDFGMEGVVIKPRIPTEGVVPYMKVRNEEYLRLVYGYDYQRRYESLCHRKNITQKAKVSLAEWDIGQKMLSAEGDDLKELVVRMVGQLKQEQTLDPRL